MGLYVGSPAYGPALVVLCHLGFLCHI